MHSRYVAFAGRVCKGLDDLVEVEERALKDDQLSFTEYILDVTHLAIREGEVKESHHSSHSFDARNAP